MHDVEQLQEFRNLLFREQLIGVYPDGIGYGNISCRMAAGDRRFYISASQTGHLEHAAPEHFVLVTDYSVLENWVACVGQMKASSESLTHSMLYDTFPDANAVVHVHNNRAWVQLQNALITSGADVPYGTPAMAMEVQRLQRTTRLSEEKIFVMGGHEDGILSFGKDLREAYDILKRALAICEPDGKTSAGSV